MERVRRRWWMRLLPKSSRVRCYVCHYGQFCAFGQQPRQGEKASAAGGKAFYVRADGVTYGPATLGDLQSWATRGRLHGGHSIRRGTERFWRPAESMASLGLTWRVRPDDRGGESYLLHPSAVAELYQEEAIPDTATVTDTQTGRTFSLEKAIEQAHS